MTYFPMLDTQGELDVHTFDPKMVLGAHYGALQGRLDPNKSIHSGVKFRHLVRVL